MFTLFKSEWLRVSKMALVAAGLHMVLLLLMVNFGLIFTTSIGLKISLAALYGFSGFLFAAQQIKLYKDGGYWIFLLNRPISERQAFCALLMAACLFVFVAVVLPFALVTLGLDVFTKQTIDWRHYTQLFYLLGLTVSFYLMGCFLTLSRSRWFVVVMILPVLTLMSLNLGGQMFLLQALVIALLFPMVILVFKINLYQVPKGSGLLFIMSAVTQWCVFMATAAVIDVAELTYDEYVHLSSGSQDSDQSNEQNKNHNNIIVSDSYSKKFNQVTNLDNKQKILAALSELDETTFKSFQQKMSLNEAYEIRKRVWFHPTAQQIQMMDERTLSLFDEESNQSWEFSHDLMLFIGHDNTTLKSIGFIGPNMTSTKPDDFTTSQRFKAVPWVSGRQFVVANQLYVFEPESRSVKLRFSAPEDQLLLNVLTQQDTVSGLVTDQSLFLFDSIDAQKEDQPLRPFVSMSLPGDYNNLWDINVIELKGQYLLSFLYGKDPRKTAYQALQLTYTFELSEIMITNMNVKNNGNLRLLTTRQLEHNSGPLLRHIDFFVSPLWAVFSDRLPPLPARDRYLVDRPWLNTLSNQVMFVLIALSMVYFALTFYLSKKRELTSLKRWLWSLINAFAGLPGVVSFVLLSEKASTSIELKTLTNNSTKDSTSDNLKDKEEEVSHA